MEHISTHSPHEGLEPAPGRKPMSLRAYAKRRGVSLAAVQKAITERRLELSVGTVRGSPKILDPELADREWTERTRPRPTGSSIPPERPAPTNLDDGDPISSGLDLFEAERIHAIEKARLARIKRETDELELALRKGEIIGTAEAKADVINLFTSVKTKLLGAPTRFRQRCPHVAAADIRELAAIVREALEGLADGDDS